MRIIKCHEQGQKFSTIANQFNLPATTVRTICVRDAQCIKNKTKENDDLNSSKPILYIQKMEKFLINWIENCNKNNIPISQLIIQQKAISLIHNIYNRAAEKSDEPLPPLNFKASRGWFQRFKVRHHLRNIALTGEAASADHEGAIEYVNELENW